MTRVYAVALWTMNHCMCAGGMKQQPQPIGRGRALMSVMEKGLSCLIHSVQILLS